MTTLIKLIKETVYSSQVASHVAMPGIIQSFDSSDMTVEVRLGIKRKNKEKTGFIEYPILVDVPIVLPTVDSFHITFPIASGDECLVVFADRCIDSWFDKGGAQDPAEERVHHLSDGFAVLGTHNSRRTITSYSSSDMVIRNKNNDQKITLLSNGDVHIETTGQTVIDSSDTLIKNPVRIEQDTYIEQNLLVDGDLTVLGIFRIKDPAGV